MFSEALWICRLYSCVCFAISVYMLLVCSGPRIASEERQWWQSYWWALGQDDGFMVFPLLLSRTCLPLVAGAGLQEWERSTNSCCRSSNHDHLLTHLSHQKVSWTEWCKVELHSSCPSLNKQTRSEEIGFPLTPTFVSIFFLYCCYWTLRSCCLHFFWFLVCSIMGQQTKEDDETCRYC